MTRVSLIVATALGIALTGLGTALPVAAAGVSSCQTDMVLGPKGIPVNRIDLFADTIAMQLRQQGYDVESVQSWGGCVKAFVRSPGGGSHMEFFDPDTLEPLSNN